MRNVIYIDGGIGRIICAVHAIESFCKNNPDTAVITSWPDVFLNNPYVQNVYNSNRGNLFDDVIKGSWLIAPEPYHDPYYYNQQAHLSQSMYGLVHKVPANEVQIEKPNLYLSAQETQGAKKLVESLRKTYNKKVIAFQPFGSSTSANDNHLHDPTFRSLPGQVANSIMETFQNDFIFVNCTHIPAQSEAVVSYNFTTRELFAFVSECDGFISCDSVVPHLGHVFDKKGVTILGATYPQNVSYPNAAIFKKEGYPKSYPTNRISNSIERNQNCMNFTDSELKTLLNLIKTTVV